MKWEEIKDLITEETIDDAAVGLAMEAEKNGVYEIEHMFRFGERIWQLILREVDEP